LLQKYSKFIYFQPLSQFAKKSCLSFSKIGHNDRGYGHGRAAGYITVAFRWSECGRWTSKMHVSQHN